MNKVFYRPGTLEVIGMSDGEDSILFPDGKPFPYIETDESHEALPNLIVELNDKKEPELYYKKGSLNDPDPIPAEEPVEEPVDAPVEEAPVDAPVEEAQTAEAVVADENSIK